MQVGWATVVVVGVDSGLGWDSWLVFNEGENMCLDSRMAHVWLEE